MSARNNCAPGVHQVSVTLTFIPHEEASEKQRRAWTWLSRELLKPVSASYRPERKAKGDRDSKNQRRRDHGAPSKDCYDDTSPDNPPSSSVE
jgi:hypothetical protein